MTRELFKAEDKSKVDATGTYALSDVLVFESAALIDAYSMQLDGSATATVRLDGKIRMQDYDSGVEIADGGVVDLATQQLLMVYSDSPSAAVDDRSVSLEFKDSAGKRTWAVNARITVVSLAFRADFDRGGRLTLPLASPGGGLGGRRAKAPCCS
jgi:hypothetical protein